MYLIFDTETTGLPRDHSAPLTEFSNWPRMVQIAWQLHDNQGDLIEAESYIIQPDGFTIPYNAEKIHKISTQIAQEHGVPLAEVLHKFREVVKQSTHLVGHNIEFDLKVVGSEFLRAGQDNPLDTNKMLDTMIVSVGHCALPGGRGGGYKYPTLEELYEKLFGSAFMTAHNAIADVAATARCLFELIRINVIDHKVLKIDEEIVTTFRNNHPNVIPPYETAESDRIKSYYSIISSKDDPLKESNDDVLIEEFTHLHVHSHFSILEATATPADLLDKAAEFEMEALALTDHGSLFGAFEFHSEARQRNIKPIIGCEFYLVQDHTKLKFTKDNPDRRSFQVLLAKNLTGYRNLVKLSSAGWIGGLYDNKPRIDKELILKYKEGLIALTGSIYSDVNDLILNFGETQAEETFIWWKEHFGDDFYVQLNRHGLPEEERTNSVLIHLAKKHNVKLVAANNVYYIEKEDADIHDCLLCIKNGEFQSTPIGWGRGTRFGFPNDEFYFKSKKEMSELFSDLPEALRNTKEIVDKVEVYDLESKPIMPHFEIPNEFADADDYLRHITYRGAAERYEVITDDIRQRIDYELETIKKMGYPGYFLIIEDFLRKARNMGIWVGPGRGSAAGSVVAYCLKITNIDPLKYGLMFERFLNHDRISLPDIDTDFDEDGRELILKWVADKYGHNRVAHIIVFGKMAPKMAIRDVARVKQLPLSEANRLAKLIPAKPGITFPKAYQQVPALNKEKNSTNTLIAQTLAVAEKLEGTIRNTGTHACGIIISKDDLIDHIPVSIAKDTELLVTQFDGVNIEKSGMLKMDFLGLKSLSIVKDTIELVKKYHGLDIDIYSIPHDDEKTYELYSRGDTTAIFQFESEGMKRSLRKLKPSRFEDLIAMNGLFRPGPMDYIPNFISRKHGMEKIEYDIPEMEEVLKETYGITVFQEQVMQLSQRLAGFTGTQADTLRKAMGKKISDLTAELKPLFFEGGIKNGYDEQALQKIWDDWSKFTAYAFNKAHSTCYAYLSYRMAYLKAHYPAEFMAAVLSRNLNDITKITLLIDEVKQMGINVLKPDVNESDLTFVVNKNKDIRFGLGAIKGMGTAVAEAIIQERNDNGPYKSIFDFARRVNLKMVNKRGFEALAMAGAFDSFQDMHRAQLFFKEEAENQLFLEKIMRYAQKFQEQQNSSQISLFGDITETTIEDPKLPQCKPWSKFEQLQYEKAVTGFYITGHPLDEYKLEITHFSNCNISDFKDNMPDFSGRTLKIGGMVTEASHLTSKDNKPFGGFIIEDFSSSLEIKLFREDYLKFKHFLTEGIFLHVTGQIQKRYSNDAFYDFKVINMQLLSEIIEKQTKNIGLIIPIETLTAELINKIFSNATAMRGKCKIYFQIVDGMERLKLNLSNANVSVNPLPFLKFVSKLKEIDYVINK
ncbi:MAG TPA: DNA polymerase III subunit alpha [Bacteroidales bacterium]|mgnify:FL=1|nr:MAG: DNA polymerase III subunit alpha [Bacteroidetes bacterium ADurb.Bin041]HNV50161.1 DNA polymerase III subunit alpha [Bacteroidales bacterium]HPW43922.1 DNA polymerase III subunit alpha [Bacteroidales bacterium]